MQTCVHHYSVQQPRPHEQQTAEEVVVVTEAHTLAEEHTVVVSSQNTHLTVIAVGAPRGSVGLTCVAVPVGGIGVLQCNNYRYNSVMNTGEIIFE